MSKPVLKSLSEQRKDSLRIALCDVSSHPVPVKLYHYPTIKLYPARKKDLPVEYFGNRADLKSYDLFLKDEASRLAKVY